MTHKERANLEEVYKKTSDLAEKALVLLTRFEEEVTGKKLANTKKKAKVNN